ncbi:hypothetical protein F444_13217 [Phytophthora nicotianae P1976]|uniref:Uncharacterized protein n=1 Tax=Phytophthora nicotianae P1976 TaxID=1317066 RepID=A0A080ZUH8_PHYNI|nr:hypothetical protein F444_13217 [Phytophthora nicotianae P1976]
MGHWFVFRKVWNDVSGLWSSRLTFEGYEVEHTDYEGTEAVCTACKKVISVPVMEVGTYWKAASIVVSVHDRTDGMGHQQRRRDNIVVCVHDSDAVADRGVDPRHYGDTVPKSND